MSKQQSNLNIEYAPSIFFLNTITLWRLQWKLKHSDIFKISEYCKKKKKEFKRYITLRTAFENENFKRRYFKNMQKS